MSDSSDFNLDHVATLARLALTADEKSRFGAQLGDVLAYISQLKEVDVSHVEPTAHSHPVFNVWADDVPRPGLSVEDALRNAPEQHSNMIAVPRVVE